jgi:hypothetical protein
MIDTSKIRAAMPGYREAISCGDMEISTLEDVVIALCNEIDRLRKLLEEE